jgi:hypothetical protein
MNSQTNLKTIFWNIGDKKDTPKLVLLSEAITTEKPDIFCIAEGTPSGDSCQEMVDVFTQKGYTCYYSPLFSYMKDLKPGYDYNDLGLKIFVKNPNIMKAPFSFAEQREEGRIIVLKVFFNYKPIMEHLHKIAKRFHKPG